MLSEGFFLSETASILHGDMALLATPKSSPVCPNRGMEFTRALSPIPAKKNPQIFPRTEGARTSPYIFSHVKSKPCSGQGGGCCVHASLLLRDPGEGRGENVKADLGTVKPAISWVLERRMD